MCDRIDRHSMRAESSSDPLLGGAGGRGGSGCRFERFSVSSARWEGTAWDGRPGSHHTGAAADHRATQHAQTALPLMRRMRAFHRALCHHGSCRTRTGRRCGHTWGGRGHSRGRSRWFLRRRRGATSEAETERGEAQNDVAFHSGYWFGLSPARLARADDGKLGRYALCPAPCYCASRARINA